MTTKNKWMVGVSIVIGLVILFFLPAIWNALFPYQGFGMMNNDYGMMGFNHAPMMGGRGGYGTGMMSFGMFFLWLIPLGLLTLIGLGIAALIKYLRSA